MNIRSIVIGFVFAAVVVSARAQPYPSHPITLIVPFPAGGPTDTLARLLGERMRITLGQPIVIETVTGARASLGVARAAKSAPDGYTALLGNWTSNVGAGVMYPAVHEAVLEMRPVAMISATPLLIVGKTMLPPKDAKELIVWLKANPDKTSAATVGAGSAAHVCLLYFQQKTGTSFALVPYRGGAPVMQDLVAGQIDLFCAEASQTLPFLRSGKIKAFAVMSKARWPGAPDVPTSMKSACLGCTSHSGTAFGYRRERRTISSQNSTLRWSIPWPIRPCASASLSLAMSSQRARSRRPRGLLPFTSPKSRNGGLMQAANIKPD